MSFSLDEMPDTPAELPMSVKLMRETIEIIAKFLPNGLTMTGSDGGINITTNNDLSINAVQMTDAERLFEVLN